VIRSDTSFHSRDVRCAAWRYRPDRTGAHPCVVMAHGFAGVREQRLDAYAERFADAGLGVLVFDYRHFGASGGEPRQLVHIARQHEDWRAAIAHARSLEDIDPDKVALWGTSFSGGHVVELAAGDHRVAAVVSQSPFTDGLSGIRAAGVTHAVRLTLASIRDRLAALAGREPIHVPAVGQPGSLAAMTAPGTEAGILAIDPPGSTWQNRVAPRAMPSMIWYRPYARFSKLRMPVLVAVCERDATTPHEPAVRAAECSPNAELRRYPIGHFDIYLEPQFERIVADQTEFLVRNLLGRRARRPFAAGPPSLRPDRDGLLALAQA